MNVLVIGGNGFIGKNIVSALKKTVNNLVIFDLNSNSLLNQDNLSYIKGDISNIALLKSVMLDYAITHVIHLASTTLPKSSNEDMKFDVSSNVISTLDILDLCVQSNIQKIIFMSSGGAIYGLPNYSPIDENHSTNPICSYGIVKLMIEKYLNLYNHLYGLKYISLRAANPYGIGQNPRGSQGVIANFIHKLSIGEPVEIWGDGSIVRDFFDVRDLSALVVKALFSDAIGVFNAGSGLGVSLNQLIDLIAHNLSLSPNVICRDSRKFDVPSIILNCSKARNVFGWRAEIDLDSGIKQYMASQIQKY